MEVATEVQFPKVAIRFCVQCKWNLRAAYFAQELLQTFSNTIGEVSLIPVTGGIFTITLYNVVKGDQPAQDRISETLIWDRKRDGGFPETKELKNRVRNVIDPERDMGHVDRALKKNQPEQVQPANDSEVVSAGDDAHSGHKTVTTPAADCEECREATQADRVSS